MTNDEHPHVTFLARLGSTQYGALRWCGVLPPAAWAAAWRAIRLAASERRRQR